MSEKPGKDLRRKAWWGVLLVAVGVFFMLREFALFDLPSIQNLWPAFIVAYGVVRLATFRHPDDVGTGVFFALIGLWFFAVQLDWWGFTYRNSWPVVLIIWGFTSVVQSALERGARRRAGGAS